MVAQLVYILCALASTVCALLLLRGYRRSRTRLLLWSSVSFLCFALSNVLLFVDLVITPTGPDLALLRAVVSFVSLLILVVGLILEGEA